MVASAEEGARLVWTAEANSDELPLFVSKRGRELAARGEAFFASLPSPPASSLRRFPARRRKLAVSLPQSIERGGGNALHLCGQTGTHGQRT